MEVEVVEGPGGDLGSDCCNGGDYGHCGHEMGLRT